MTQKVLNREQIRRFDRIAIEQFGIDSLVLMENAARATTDILCECAVEKSAVILCGPGNNGGDGLVIARHLHIRGWRTSVILLANRQKLSQDSMANLRILTQTAVPIIDAQGMLIEQIAIHMDGFAWIVDAIVGTGARPPLRSPLDEVVNLANILPAKRMAIDIPSGLDCDSGTVDGVVFRADLTVSFVALKPVMVTNTGKAWCGETRIVDIGAPPEVFEFVQSDPVNDDEPAQAKQTEDDLNKDK